MFKSFLNFAFWAFIVFHISLFSVTHSDNLKPIFKALGAYGEFISYAPIFNLDKYPEVIDTTPLSWVSKKLTGKELTELFTNDKEAE